MAEMTGEVFTILTSAVTLARNEGIKRVSTLKARLMTIYQNREKEIDEAIAEWARYVHKKGRDEI